MRNPRTAAVQALLAVVTAVAAVSVGPQLAQAQDAAAAADKPRVLVWGGTYGFRHPSITKGELTFIQLAQQSGAFDVVVTENPADLSMLTLRQYDVLAWISTTGKAPMTEQQREDVIRWSQCGGGNLGFHAVLDSEYGWAEHAELFGAQFDSHPKNVGTGQARMLVEDREHPVTEGWSDRDSFLLDDEYYRWRSAKRVPGVSLPRNDAATDVLLSLDETTVAGNIQEGPLAYERHQPIAWTKTFRGGGRVYYNNMGHSEATWDQPEFRTSIVNGVDWVGQVRPDEQCLDGDEDVSTVLTPPPADPDAAGRPCSVPDLGTRTGPAWERSGPARALTENGDKQQLAAGIPGGLSWGAQTWVLDLSRTGALTADVEVTLTWPVPADDYDLSVTTGWGTYGSDGLVGRTSEQVVMRDVPHCAVLHAAGDNMLAASGRAPALATTVTPNVGTTSAPPASPATATIPADQARVTAARALPVTGADTRWSAPLTLVALAGLAALRLRRRTG